MRRVEQLPAAISRFDDLGGVVEFAIFEDADGAPDAVFDAICASVPIENPEALRAIGFRPIDERTFYGDWYDAATDSLLLIGQYTFADGRNLVNPRLRDLGDARIHSGASALPEPGAGGGFAYAFSHPPYSIRAPFSEVQALFDKVRHSILPRGVDHEILDWSSPDLPKAGSYFEMGIDWWGVFLFSIYVPAHRRLTIVWASTSD